MTEPSWSCSLQELEFSLCRAASHPCCHFLQTPFPTEPFVPHSLPLQ